MSDLERRISVWLSDFEPDSSDETIDLMRDVATHLASEAAAIQKVRDDIAEELEHSVDHKATGIRDVIERWLAALDAILEARNRSR